METRQRAGSEHKTLHMALLGRFDIRVAGNPCDVGYAKLRGLLALLVMSAGTPLRREYLAELFWPEMQTTAGRQNLRRALFNLRYAMGEAGQLLTAKQDMVTLASQDTWLDVAELTAALPSCKAASASVNCNPCLAQMEFKAGLYRGEFMAGFSLPDCPDFEDWLHIQRETLLRRTLALLEKLSSCHEQISDYGKALQFALRHAELEPWDEDAHRSVMRLYALNGQSSAAIAQYEACCRQLKDGLGALPSDETRHLAEHIRKGKLGRHSPGTVAPPPQTVPWPDAERRQVTVLYCELALATIDDPEEAMELLRTPQARCVEIIRQFSGHIVQTHGGGLLAYFGYPRADEHAARHAVQAALAGARVAANGIEIRVGVHTGLMVTGGESSMPDIVGKTSRLAIQLRQSISPGEVAISQQTHGLVAGYFDCVSLDDQSVHNQPPEIFRVVQESGASTRLDASTHLTPLVGRTAEITQLLKLWKSSGQGVRHVVLIQGEAGIGKSRLLHTLKELLAEKSHAVRELRCFPEFSQSPFYPLIAMLEVIFCFAQGETPEEKSVKLARYLEAHYPAAAQDALPLLSHLLSLHPGGDYETPILPPQKRKEQTIAILLDLMRALAAEQPVLLIIEDLHWMDPSTLEVLTRFVGQDWMAPILVLLSARPEFEPPWTGARKMTLTLAPLIQDEAAKMVASISEYISPETTRHIVERADGVPLFVEEMAKVAVMGNQSSIPTTLQDLLAARMDMLGEAKRAAQLAAAIGREFELDLLHKVTLDTAAELAGAISALQDAGLILRLNETTSRFKHALIQEAVYQSQSKACRQTTHKRIAQALLRDFPEVAVIRPEVIAQHLNSGGEVRQAIEYWLKAAQRTPLHSASAETVAYLKAGLQALTSLPDDIEKDRLEFELQVRLGFALQATQGYGAAASVQAFYNAIELSKKIGNTPGLFQALLGLADGISSHPDFDHTAGLNLARQLLSLAQESGDSLQLQQAHYALGSSLYWMGDFATSRFHHEQSIALDPLSSKDVKADYSGRVSSVASQAFLSCILWLQGHPEQAQATSLLSIKRARQFSHPNTLAFILTFAAALHRWSGNKEASLSCAEEGLLIAQKMDFPVWLITNSLQQGWVQSMQGNAEGVAQIRRCVDNMRMAMGGVIIFFSAVLADVLLHHGQAEESLGVLSDAFDEGKKKNDHHFEAELNRLKGECLMALSRSDEAEACFRRALEISHGQGAKSIELRAATSMARLWQQQGKQEDARRVLAKINDGFSEGFDTLDLREAAKLLFTLV